MTRRELAKLANVSYSAVSKAFNDDKDISEETKNHIFAVAKQYGCFGDFFKGKYHKRVIAIICPEIQSNYYAEFIRCFQSLIESEENILIISSDNFDKSRATDLIEYYESFMKADGIITIGLNVTEKRGYKVPIVSVFSNSFLKTDTVVVDFNDALFKAVKLLDSLGHKNIVFLSENLTKVKEEQYKKAMKGINNNRTNIIRSDYRFEKAGGDGIDKLLKSGLEFSAVICAYDNIAIGAVKELKRNGLCVPDDVSVIGFDNISSGYYAETALTTIDSKQKEVCAAAWELLKQKIDNPYKCKRYNKIINAELVVRESVSKFKTNKKTHCKS